MSLEAKKSIQRNFSAGWSRMLTLMYVCYKSLAKPFIRFGIQIYHWKDFSLEEILITISVHHGHVNACDLTPFLIKYSWHGYHMKGVGKEMNMDIVDVLQFKNWTPGICHLSRYFHKFQLLQLNRNIFWQTFTSIMLASILHHLAQRRVSVWGLSIQSCAHLLCIKMAHSVASHIHFSLWHNEDNTW